MNDMSIAELIVGFAVKLGIKNGFSLVGGMAMHINKAMFDNKELNVTYLHHEQAVVSAAEGFVKTRNFQEIALVSVTAGPGVSNSISGLLSAYGDSVPILILAGQIKTSDINKLNLRTHGIQEINTDQLIPPAVKKFIRLSENSLVDDLIMIEACLQTGRPGPVFVEIPLDVQSTKVDSEAIFQEFYNRREPKVDPRDLDISTYRQTLVELLEVSTRVGIYIGNGFRIAGQSIDDLLKVLDAKGIPRFYSWLSLDLEQESNPINMGCPGALASIHSNTSLQELDLLIVIGARLDLASTAFDRNNFGSKAKRVIFDIDQCELEKFETPRDTKFLYDLRNGLNWLLQVLENYIGNSKDWVRKITNEKIKSLNQEHYLLNSNALNARNLAICISEYKFDQVVIPASSGVAEEIFTRFFKPNGKSRFFNGAALGSMGHGLPQAIGAILARDSKNTRIVCLEGDGGLWMSSQEIATLKLLNPANFFLVILNNNGYASIKLSQRNHLNYVAGCDQNSGILLPNWSKLAAVFSLEYTLVTNLNELQIVFNDETKKDSLQIIDVQLPMDEQKGPKIPTVMFEGKPTTGKLEEIAW